MRYSPDEAAIGAYSHRGEVLFGHIEILHNLLPTRGEEREVLVVGSIPVAILPSCQDMETIAL